MAKQLVAARAGCVLFSAASAALICLASVTLAAVAGADGASRIVSAGDPRLLADPIGGLNSYSVQPSTFGPTQLLALFAGVCAGGLAIAVSAVAAAQDPRTGRLGVLKIRGLTIAARAGVGRALRVPERMAAMAFSPLLWIVLLLTAVAIIPTSSLAPTVGEVRSVSLTAIVLGTVGLLLAIDGLVLTRLMARRARTGPHPGESRPSIRSRTRSETSTDSSSDSRGAQ